MMHSFFFFCKNCSLLIEIPNRNPSGNDFGGHTGPNGMQCVYQISQQSYEWLTYVQGYTCGSFRKSPHLRVVFSYETLH